MLQKPFLASYFKYVVELANLFVILLVWGSYCFAYYGPFRSSASRHTLRVPLALQAHVSELTQGVGTTCGVMLSCMVVSVS